MHKTSGIMLAGGLIFAIGLGLKLTNKDFRETGETDQKATVSAETTTETNELINSVSEIQKKLDKVLEESAEAKTEQPTETTSAETPAPKSQSAIADSNANKIYMPRTAGEQRNLLKTPNLNWEKIQSAYAISNGIDDWRKLVSESHWKKGYSAYELAHSWTNANPALPREIAALFDGSAKLLIVTPEHNTPLPGGSSPSQSDALAFIRLKDKVCAVAVEGKMKESFGTTVGKWSKNASAGKVKRLKHISDKLGLAYPPADEIRYQLLHRTASAIIEAERFNADCAAMIVHSFSDERAGFDDFVKFLKSLGIRSVAPGKLYESTRSDIPLLLGWATP